MKPTPEERARRDAALRQSLVTFERLRERVNQVEDDGYDVGEFFSTILLDVSQVRLAAGQIGDVEQSELFTREYERHMTLIDLQFPRRT